MRLRVLIMVRSDGGLKKEEQAEDREDRKAKRVNYIALSQLATRMCTRGSEDSPEYECWVAMRGGGGGGG